MELKTIVKRIIGSVLIYLIFFVLLYHRDISLLGNILMPIGFIVFLSIIVGVVVLVMWLFTSK